ncbi:MAG: hypothetical protein HFE63_04475 [Clostridiales bacterium]|nr:hypothetical protein [Clostridiales bacterium]
MKQKCDSEERICAMCRFSSEISGREDMLCSKKGVVPREFSCRKYIYEPLKRVPRKLPEFPSLDDISID